MEEPDTLKIRFDEDEGKWYVYFTGPWGQCAYQSDPLDRKSTRLNSSH